MIQHFARVIYNVIDFVNGSSAAKKECLAGAYVKVQKEPRKYIRLNSAYVRCVPSEGSMFDIGCEGIIPCLSWRLAC